MISSKPTSGPRGDQIGGYGVFRQVNENLTSGVVYRIPRFLTFLPISCSRQCAANASA
jgi:hypothetical protein